MAFCSPTCKALAFAQHDHRKAPLEEERGSGSVTLRVSSPYPIHQQSGQNPRRRETQGNADQERERAPKEKENL
ncbi:hypothetical protein D5R40_16055 [Okeania hirsuta]|uniref:Uncharacterized protein n=1 Tax=Okeania hirsuta TaxID=1458930 RepID=A0A3N6RNA9_9CYAN|nr:hypothetical protein D4Z78_04990 [Okeania hirsuta]RQH40824.1 hypothetical protein D5R40_16055 [Okeania hirsuta]